MSFNFLKLRAQSIKQAKGLGGGYKLDFLKLNALLALAIAATMVGSVFAQSGTSGISGTVTDQNGAVVPGATVTISNASKGFTRSVTTDENGRYSFLGIPPATYKVEVEAAGFKQAISGDVRALVDSINTFDVVLEAGKVEETVTVTSNTIESIVNTQDASIGNNFVARQITQLPTDLRRVTDLLTLQPGVTRAGYATGARSDQANIILDGVDINDQQNGGRTAQFGLSQGTALRLTTEAVKEFRITTTNANANQGRSSGVQIQLVTKSGTNDFRGSAFYFYRPTKFSANTFFNNKSKIERPGLARDVFGGAIGGRIIKDKLFFFYSYEGQRESSSRSEVRLVPLASLGRGELKFRGKGPNCGAINSDPRISNCTLSLVQLNNIFAKAKINPAALAVFADAASRYPANDDTIGDGFNTAGFRFNQPLTISENTHIARFDWNLNDDHQLFVRGNYQWDITTEGGFFPDTKSTDLWSHPYGYVVGHNWTINSNMVNNFRYGLTRVSLSDQGDSNENVISFRQVFTPLDFSRTIKRVNPTTNITDDFTWIKGAHTFQFGGNIRLIRNKRVSFSNAFDSANANSSFYERAGRVVTDPIIAAGYSAISDLTNVQRVAASMIGRFSQYTARFTFDRNGALLSPGTEAKRTFATEEYDVYAQDIWKPLPNLTLTLGLRYGLSRPVREVDGFQVRPTRALGQFLKQRIVSAAMGAPLNEPITFQLAGPDNNAPGFYPMDKNNFQPSIAVAWSPSFENSILSKLFGADGESTFRGGFRIVNDYFGQQLAVNFDGLSAVGFTESDRISAETYNITDNLAPRFTGYNQNIRNLPGLFIPKRMFLSLPSDGSRRIQTSLDTDLVSPIHYSWNFSYGRQLPKGMYVEFNYVGRAARNLLGARDIMAINNIVDPVSGMDWYTAATTLRNHAIAKTPVSRVQSLPFFENLFGNILNILNRKAKPTKADRIIRQGPTVTQGLYRVISPSTDWTGIQLFLNNKGVVPDIFYHPQYAALSAFGTIASSDYHGASINFRQRLGSWLTYDFNYTYSKSMDDVSGLQTAGSFGSGFILNPIRPKDSRSISDFDTTHVINANFVVQLPFGKGQLFDNFGDIAEYFVGGWQLGGIFRFNTGRPWNACFDDDGWDTNWNVKSRCVRIKPIRTSPTRTVDNPNLFSDLDQLAASLRGPAPGETGDRNAFRDTGYSVLDMNLNKTFQLPWNENHKIQFRWEVFNVFNKQHLSGANGVGVSENTTTSPVTFNSSAGRFTGIRGAPRRMQFGLRYEF